MLMNLICELITPTIVFNVNTLNLAEVVKSIGFLAPPTNFHQVVAILPNLENNEFINTARRYQRANKYRKF
ncbi:hypothetical protein TKK_0006815 [Trichogramma kaykai]